MKEAGARFHALDGLRGIALAGLLVGHLAGAVGGIDAAAPKIAPPQTSGGGTGQGSGTGTGTGTGAGSRSGGSTQPPAAGIIPQIDHLESVAPDRIQQTTVDGRNVLAFTVKPGDVQRWDANNIGPSGMPNQRAEVSYAAAAGVDKRNSPYNVTSDSGQRSYAMSIKFGDGFRLDQRWATLLQFHESDTNPKPGFQGIAIHGDHMDFATPFHPETPFASIPVKTGNWYDLKLDINWSAGQDGYIKVFNNNQLVGQYNGPTASPGTYYYLKQGYYRDGAISQPGTVYQTPVSITGSGANTPSGTAGLPQ